MAAKLSFYLSKFIDHLYNPSPLDRRILLLISYSLCRHWWTMIKLTHYFSYGEQNKLSIFKSFSVSHIFQSFNHSIYHCSFKQASWIADPELDTLRVAVPRRSAEMVHPVFSVFVLQIIPSCCSAASWACSQPFIYHDSCLPQSHCFPGEIFPTRNTASS